MIKTNYVKSFVIKSNVIFYKNIGSWMVNVSVLEISTILFHIQVFPVLIAVTY